MTENHFKTAEDRYREMVIRITGQEPQPLSPEDEQALRQLGEEFEDIKADSRRRQISSARAARNIILNC